LPPAIKVSLNSVRYVFGEEDGHDEALYRRIIIDFLKEAEA
jgi:hypothetical protein